MSGFRPTGEGTGVSVGMVGAPLVMEIESGLLASWAASWLGAANLRRYRVRFVELVWPGDVLTCSGNVVRHRELNGESCVDVELDCTRQTGEVVVRGEATFVVPMQAPVYEAGAPAWP